MALALSRNTSGLRRSLSKRVWNANGSPLVQAAPVQVSQDAALRHMGTDKYPYVKPFPYWKKKFNRLRNLWENSNHRMCEQSKVIVIDGNVGVGKHKFAQRLAQEFDLMYFRGLQDDDLWVQAWNGFNRRDLNDTFDDEECKLLNLSDFYNDPNLGADRVKLGQAARMQYECMVKRCLQYTYMLLHLLSTGQGIVIVRSPFTDPVFARAMRDVGYLSGPYTKFQVEHFGRISQYLMTPHLNIYLDAPVEVCMDNIKKRQQQNPKYATGPNLNEDFLGRIEHHYRSYLDANRKDHEVLELDWAEAPTESELDVIWEFISYVPMEPVDNEGTRYNDWCKMVEDKTGDRRLKYTDRDRMLAMFENGVPLNAPEFKLHHLAHEQLSDIYDQHPMTRYRQNYATTGTFNMLMGGGLLANLGRPTKRKDIN